LIPADVAEIPIKRPDWLDFVVNIEFEVRIPEDILLQSSVFGMRPVIVGFWASRLDRRCCMVEEVEVFPLRFERSRFFERSGRM
jgi:hypothetical protein